MDTQTKNEKQRNLVFLQDSIRDYFAAEHIQNCWNIEGIRTRLYIRQRRSNPRWEETIAFLAGLLENPDALLHTLIKPLWWEVLKTHMKAYIRPNHVNIALVTAGKCIEMHVENPPSYGQKLLNRLIQTANSDRNKYAKINAIRTLVKIGSNEAIEGLLKCFTKSLTDNKFGMGRIAIDAITEIRTEKAGLALIRALRFINDNVSIGLQGDSLENSSLQDILIGIEHGLYYVVPFDYPNSVKNSVKIVKEVIKILHESESVVIREAICRFLFSIRSSWIDLIAPEAFPNLFTAALGDKSDKVRFRTAKEICWTRFPSETNLSILHVLKSPDFSNIIKVRAITLSYGKGLILSSSELQEYIHKIFFSDSEPGSVRSAAVWPVFYKCNSIEARKEFLKKCVRDSDYGVRRLAALSASDSRCYITDYDKYLLQLLCDDESEVSEAAAQALIKHGDAVVIEKLRNLINTDISEKAAIVIRNTIAGIEQKFLFSIDSKFKSDLDNATISEELRQEFENNGISLSQNPIVFFEKKGSRWIINDKGETSVEKKGTRRTIITCTSVEYLIGKKEDKLYIYDNTF